MKLLPKKNLLLLTCLFGLMMPLSYAQKVSADELLRQALIETNVNKNYQQAIHLAEQGLAISPNYIDIGILLGRLNLLSEKYDNAIHEFDKVLTKHPDQADALKYMINAQYQNHNIGVAIKFANRYLSYYPFDRLMLIKKIAMLSESNAFSEAKQEIKHVLKENPKDSDFVYLHRELLINEARFFLLQKDTLNTIAVYEEALKDYPEDTISRNQLIGMEIEQHHYQNALKHLDSGLKYYQDPENLLIKKVALFQQMGNIEEAGDLASTLHFHNPKNKKIKDINNEIFHLNGRNQVILNYALTAFDQTNKKSWRQYSLSYTRTGRFGALTGRINYADRINSNGYQIELETYPTHSVGYSFINFSYANSMVFPRIRWSYSFFIPVSKGWGTELGFRYIKSDAGILGFTGAVDKYINRYWLNLKTFLMFNDGRVTGSYLLSGRYYVNDSTDDYFTAILGYGFSPDDRGGNRGINERFSMQSSRITVAYQLRLWNRNVAGISSTFNKQQYQIMNYRYEYEAALIFKHKF